MKVLLKLELLVRSFESCVNFTFFAADPLCPLLLPSIFLSLHATKLQAHMHTHVHTHTLIDKWKESVRKDSVLVGKTQDDGDDDNDDVADGQDRF